MAIRESIDRKVVKFHSYKAFSHPIPELIEEAEGCTDRIAWLWDDFSKSLNRHLKLSKPFLGRQRNRLQQIAFLNGVERMCAEFSRRCENVTMTLCRYRDSPKIGLRISRLRPVLSKDRHQNQPFVATIPEIETTVPARATFVGMQDEMEATSELPLAAAVTAIPLEASDGSSPRLVYAEVLGSL